MKRLSCCRIDKPQAQGGCHESEIDRRSPQISACQVVRLEREVAGSDVASRVSETPYAVSVRTSFARIVVHRSARRFTLILPTHLQERTNSPLGERTTSAPRAHNGRSDPSSARSCAWPQSPRLGGWPW